MERIDKDAITLCTMMQMPKYSFETNPLDSLPMFTRRDYHYKRKLTFNMVSALIISNTVKYTNRLVLLCTSECSSDFPMSVFIEQKLYKDIFKNEPVLKSDLSDVDYAILLSKNEFIPTYDYYQERYKEIVKSLETKMFGDAIYTCIFPVGVRKIIISNMIEKELTEDCFRVTAFIAEVTSEKNAKYYGALESFTYNITPYFNTVLLCVTGYGLYKLGGYITN